LARSRAVVSVYDHSVAARDLLPAGANSRHWLLLIVGRQRLVWLSARRCGPRDDRVCAARTDASLRVLWRRAFQRNGDARVSTRGGFCAWSNGPCGPCSSRATEHPDVCCLLVAVAQHAPALASGSESKRSAAW